MSKSLVTRSTTSLGRIGFSSLPRLITNAGERATKRFVEFFTANIRNKNTRLAYAQAVGRFADWCEKREFALDMIEPVVVAAYVEQLCDCYEPPTAKQHLAAIRMLFDYLVVGQVIPMNPASSVRGPKHVMKKGKTPVLDAKEARELLDSIDTTEIAGLRDRALIGLMVYSFARVSAAVGMDAEDYLQRGKRCWFRLREKGGKHHEVPAHHNAVEYVDAFLATAPAAKKIPLFRTIDRNGDLTERRLTRNDALRMIKRRVRKAGLPAEIWTLLARHQAVSAVGVERNSLRPMKELPHFFRRTQAWMLSHPRCLIYLFGVLPRRLPVRHVADSASVSEPDSETLGLWPTARSHGCRSPTASIRPPVLVAQRFARRPKA